MADPTLVALPGSENVVALLGRARTLTFEEARSLRRALDVDWDLSADQVRAAVVGAVVGSSTGAAWGASVGVCWAAGWGAAWGAYWGAAFGAVGGAAAGLLVKDIVHKL